MAWEKVWLEAFFFDFVGVIGAYAESKSSFMHRANACKMPSAPCLAFPARRGDLLRVHTIVSETISPLLSLRSGALKVRLNFFQRFPFRLRQEKRCGHKVNDGAGSESEEHSRVSMLANGRQKNRCDGRGHTL